MAILRLSGNIPVIRDWFIIRVRGLIRPGEIDFSSLTDIPSCPVDVLVFNFLIIFEVSSAESNST